MNTNRKFIIVLGLCLLVLVLTVIVERAYGQEGPTVDAGLVHYFVIESQAVPFQIEDNDKNHRGIITETVFEIFKNSGYQLKVWTYPFKRMIRYMERGRFKNWINFGTHGWYTIQSRNLTYLPIINVKNVLISYNNPDFEYTSLDDLNGKTLIVLSGFDYPGLMQYAQEGNMEVLNVRSHEAAFGVLKRLGDRGFFVELRLRAKYNLRNVGLAGDTNYRLHNMSTLITDYNIYIAMSPSIDKELKHFINSRVRELHDNGTIKKIISQYE